MVAAKLHRTAEKIGFGALTGVVTRMSILPVESASNHVICPPADWPSSGR